MNPCRFFVIILLASLSLAAAVESEDKVTLRRCVNFMASYAGSWLASSKLFHRTNWLDRAALEFATRDMYNAAHSRKGSGWKTNDPLTDFMVLHLSGIEHSLVRSFGFAKGIAQTNHTSHQVLEEVLSRPSLSVGASALRPSSSSSFSFQLAERTVGVVPFYGGAATVLTTASKSGGREVMNATLPTGAGNSHTLAPTDLKCLQVSSVVASVLSYVGTVVVGVVSPQEAVMVSSALAKFLPSHLLEADRVQVVVIPCGGMSVYLPYRLLNWAKAQHKAGGLTVAGGGSSSSSSSGGLTSRRVRRFDFLYYTEADNVLYLHRPEPVARALVSFLDSSDGENSYTLPQRLENRNKNGAVFHRRHGGSSSGAGSSSLDLSAVRTVGQNNCEDARGPTAVFSGETAMLGGGEEVVREDFPGAESRKFKKTRKRHRRRHF